ncbi:MAG: tripartite tricarboxylate transporter TctB family protein [Spirochaetia bacterium]|jgi:ABC-type phosphate transport system permease subunit|nr:tripartite tricarboxylate transporter TctB family protein [Spirochaetia bacterium]
MQKKKITSKMLIPVFTALAAVLFISFGYVKYGFWHHARGPQPGFFPVIIGSVLLVMSVLAFVTSLKEEGTGYPLENWYPAFGTVLVMLSTLVIGMLPSLAVFVVLWLKWYEKYSWKTTLIVFAVMMGIVVGAFVFWLGVPFPKGIIYDLIVN